MGNQMQPARIGRVGGMPAAMPRLIPVIAGPTAGGKSDLAVEVALCAARERGVEAEIITADAFQVYRGMDIGTAKPTMAERRGVPHWLIDVMDPWEAAAGAGGFTVEDWLRQAEAAIEEVRGRGRWPVVVGGTHLYIKALLDGLFEGPEPDAALRAELTAMDAAARRAELERVDPAAAGRIHFNDVRRTVRALEVFRLTGRPISEHQRQWDAPEGEDGSAGEGAARRGRYQLVVLDWEVEAINRRINARVKAMFERGLLEEVRRLAAGGVVSRQPAEALGYKQLWHLVRAGGTDGAWPPPPRMVEEAVEKVKIETRRLGKNQRTWLKRLRLTPGAMAIACPPVPGAEVARSIMERCGSLNG